MNSADKKEDIIHQLHPSLREFFMPFPLSTEDIDKMCPPEKRKRIVRDILRDIEKMEN